MVRPNQIIQSDPEEGRLTFIMFARSERMVKRRVMALNFPGEFPSLVLGEKDVDDVVVDVTLLNDGVLTNRYAVSVDLDNL